MYRLSTVFQVSPPPERVAAFLANPRNIVVANHPRPVLEATDGPVHDGSWFVIGLDQLRARVEYTAFDPPRRVVVTMSLSGRGSGGVKSTQEFVLSSPQGVGTRVETAIEAEGGFLTFTPIMRALQRVAWWHLRRRIEARA